MGTTPYPRPVPIAAFAGAHESSLARAIVRYRPVPDGDDEAIDDLGLALVLEGEYAVSAEVLDLGSGRTREIDLGAELVVLDWAFETTLEYVRILRLASGDTAPGAPASEPLRQYCQALALGALRRTGYGDLTRPIFLRVGFRDIVRDLDLNDTCAIRLALDDGDYARIRLDVDHNALLIETTGDGASPDLERLLLDAFPIAEVRRTPRPAYQLRFALPVDLGEARELMAEIRRGVLRLFEVFEPERHRAIREALDVFGPRDTLRRLERRGRADGAVRLRLLSGAMAGAAPAGVS